MALNSAAFVARALERSWRKRPIRLIAAVAAGIGGVMLTTAVLLIASTVLGALQTAPVQGVAPGVVAVEAQAPGGMSGALVDKALAAAGQPKATRMVVANTTVEAAGETSAVIAFGVDLNLAGLLDSSVLQPGMTMLGPDSVYLTRGWAQSHGVFVGDSIVVAAPGGARTWKVADLIDSDFANGGSVVVAPLGSMVSAFGRGNSADVLMFAQPTDPAALDRMTEVLDGAALVVSPDKLFAGYNRTFKTSLSILAMYVSISLLTSGVVLFLTWRLVLTDAAPILSRLKLLGVRARDLILGSAVVMVPILLMTYVLGAVLGLLLGTQMSDFVSQITNLTGQALNPGFPWVLPVLGAFVGAVVMFGCAWLSGVYRLRKTSAIDAVTGRDNVAVHRTRLVPALALAGVAVVIAVLILAFAPGIGRAAAVVPLFLALAVATALAPVVLGIAVRRGGSGPGALFVGRQLEVGWRRSAALSIMFGVAIATSVVMSGVSSSVKNDVATSVERWTTVPILVEAAPVGQNLGSETLPANIGKKEIENLPGVAGTYTYSYTNIGIDGDRYPIWSWGGASDLSRYVDLRVVEGPADFLDTFGTEKIAVSASFSRTRGVGVGDTLDIPRPDGHRTYPIAAIVDDAASDGGMIIVADPLYRELVGDSGVYSVGIAVQPDADLEQVRTAVSDRLAADYPRAVVITTGELRAAMASITARLTGAFETFAWVMFLVAAAVGAATLASSFAERQHPVALTRLVGGATRRVRGQLAVESLLIAFGAWVVAVPLGLLLMPAVLAGLSFQSGLMPVMVVPVPLLVASVPLTVLAVGFALFVARRSSSELPLSQLMATE